MYILSYTNPKLLIIVVVLYIIGMILKGLKMIPDKFIPIILIVFGILFACLMIGWTGQAVLQGVLLTGLAVYGNQLFKQLFNKTDSADNNTE